MKGIKHSLAQLLTVLLLSFFTVFCFAEPYGIALSPQLILWCGVFCLLLGAPLLLRRWWKLTVLLPLGLAVYLCREFWGELLESLCLAANRYILSLNEYHAAQVVLPYNTASEAAPFPGLLAIGFTLVLLICLGALLFRSVIFSALPLALCVAIGVFSNCFPPLWAAAGAVSALALLCLLLLPKEKQASRSLYAGGLVITLSLTILSALLAPSLAAWVQPASGALKAFQDETVGTFKTVDLPVPKETLLNNESLRFTGRTLLEATVDQVTFGDLYLKEASYGDYLGGSWGTLPQRAFLDFSRSTGIDGTRLLRQSYDAAAIAGEGLTSISLYRYDGAGALAPYNSLPVEETELVGDGYLVSGSNPISFIGYPGAWILPDNYVSLPDYEAFVRENYLALPDLPRLKALAESFQLDSITELDMQIRTAILSSAVYNLDIPTPSADNIPMDYVENFLFQQKSGYCQHFASAAVLLYRYCGVPARYVTGYAVPAESFRPGPKGMTAAVQDNMAHAWAEIYLPGQGWTIVDMTPGGVREQMQPAQAGSAAASVPPEAETPKPQATVAPAPTPVAPTAPPVKANGVAEAASHLFPVFAVFLSAGFVALCFMARRRILTARRYNRISVLLRDLFALLEFSLGKPQGSTSDRAYLRGAFAACRLEGAEELADAMEKLAFSKNKLTREEYEFIRRMYVRVQKELRQKLSPFKKLIFDWIYCFG